jgi:hypothetical protein
MQAEDAALAPSGAPMRFRDERNASQIWQNKTKKLRDFGKTKPKSCEISTSGLEAYPLHGGASGSYRSRMTRFHGTGFA